MDPVHLYWYAAAGFAVWTPVALVARRFDRRKLAGENVWNKPAKFGISLALHFATFAVVAGSLGNGIVLLTVAWLSVGAAVLEVGYIAVQAGRQRRSHFNEDTRVEAAIYAISGIGALLVLSPAVAVGIAAALSPPLAWPPAVRLAVPVAFIVGAGLTLLITLRMGSLQQPLRGPAALDAADHVADGVDSERRRPSACPFLRDPHHAGRACHRAGGVVAASANGCAGPLRRRRRRLDVAHARAVPADRGGSTAAGLLRDTRLIAIAPQVAPPARRRLGDSVGGHLRSLCHPAKPNCASSRGEWGESVKTTNKRKGGRYYERG